MSTSCRIARSTPSAPSTASTPAGSARSASATSTARSRSPRCGCSTSSPTATRRPPPTLGRDLGLDAGYLSRILRRFETRGLLGRRAVAGRRPPEPAPPDPEGARRVRAARSARRGRGRDAARPGRPTPDRREVVDAMGTIERLLGAPRRAGRSRGAVSAAAASAGRHGLGRSIATARSTRASGATTSEFEALVARICADFLDHFDPAGERCWIAERDGEIVGSVFLVRKSKTVAKLRLLLVEPSARGLGIGRPADRRVHPLRAARPATARSRCGPRAISTRRAGSISRPASAASSAEPHDSFGRKGLVAETWDLTLSPPRS